jgi:DNA repair protein SbcD/Mre11
LTAGGPGGRPRRARCVSLASSLPLAANWSRVIRLLHTADWHLGATLQGWSREPEHRAALTQLVAMARARDVNAIIVAGDIFDSLNPSAEAQRLFYDTLRDLRAACPRALIALIAGNHDPAGRLEAPRALFEMAAVHSLGVVTRREGGLDLSAHLLPIHDAAGSVGAYLLAMPYPRAADLPIAGTEVAISPVVWGVRELYREAVEAARAQIGGAPLVVTGHLHVAGGLESEGAERRILVGGEHAAPPDVFPADAAYVALGHLHRPQHVGRETIRYSGALIPMSKAEIDYRHGAVIVEIDAAGNAVAEDVPFKRSVQHLRMPRQGALAVSEVENALVSLALDPATPDAARPFLHLAVRIDGPAAGLKAEIDAICEKFPVRLVSLSIARPQSSEAPRFAPVRLAERRPLELFREAFEATHGVAPSDEHMRRFDRLAEEP